MATLVQWNLAGYSFYKGLTCPARILARTVLKQSPLPVAVVTNETCGSQFERLRTDLAPHGFAAAANWSIPDFGGRCESFGNAVFWRGDPAESTVQRITYSDAVQVDGAATREKRNLISVAFPLPDAPAGEPRPQIAVCGTHLYKDEAWAARQLVEAAAVVDAGNDAGVPTLLAGDLNLPPSSPALDPWYTNGRYAEADGNDRQAPRRTTTSNEKFDYAFLPTASMRVTSPATIQFKFLSSDHAIYVTSFELA